MLFMAKLPECHYDMSTNKVHTREDLNGSIYCLNRGELQNNFNTGVKLCHGSSLYIIMTNACTYKLE